MGWGFTNTTDADEYVRSTKLGMVTNYAKTADEPQLARLSNRTAGIEQPELVTYRSKPVNKVETQIPIRHPLPAKDGVLYSVRLENIWRDTDAQGNVTDEPIVMWLNIMHPATDTWSNSKVAVVLQRLISALLKEQESTGTPSAAETAEWRFEDLMRSALMPAED